MEKKSDELDLNKELNAFRRSVSQVRNSIEEKQNLRESLWNKWNNEIFWNFYYSNSCIVCHSIVRVDSCNRCKMIFYCGEKHRKKHWPEHKDLCKVILGMLKETGATSLFDNLKTNDAETWMRTKIDLMLKAESKLGRELVNYEREMFLFPKTCFVCHESDLSVLKTCDCGISLCKQHKKDEKHLKLCDKFQESFKLALEMQDIKPYPLIEMEASDILKFDESRETIPVQTEITNLPNSMNVFLKTYMKLKGEIAKKVRARTAYRTQILSEFISRPLTLLYAIQKLNLMTSSKLTIHVIGATHYEYGIVECWEILLHWIPALINIEVIFVGPELKGSYSRYISVCSSCKLKKKYIDTRCVDSTYENYFYMSNTKQPEFKKPDIVIGYNLDLYESELGLTKDTWKETFSILKKVNAHFILTAGTEERAKKDHKILCKLLEKSVSRLYCEPNPFAGLIPERDFQTEELRYTNKHILIYKGFYEDFGLEEYLDRREVFYAVGESEKKIESEEKQKLEQVFQFKGRKSEIVSHDDLKESNEFGLEDYLERKEKFSAFGELEKKIESEEKQKLEQVSQCKGTQSEVVVPEEKNESKEKNEPEEKNESKEKNEPEEKNESKEKNESEEDIKDSCVFQLKEKTVESHEANQEKPETKYETSSVEILIKDENKLLKENSLLKEENEQLLSENKKLKQENDQLRAENQLIKDLRSQVEESIRAAMSEKQ